MDSKTLALVSYIFTPIGWLISFFSYKGQEKNSLVSYHLRQSFGLGLVVIGLWFLQIFLSSAMWSFYWRISWLFGLISLGLFILMILGIITASKGEEKPLPLIGKMFEGQFNFIP
jgi:uncharacterized membrane protein